MGVFIKDTAIVLFLSWGRVSSNLRMCLMLLFANFWGFFHKRRGRFVLIHLRGKLGLFIIKNA